MNDIVPKISRREFLKASAAGVAGLVIGFYLPMGRGRAFAAEAPAAMPKEYPPNAFIRIAPDNTVTLLINKSEMGQGVYTSLAMLINEELEADWSKVRVESAPVAPVYNHTVFQIQLTGGSTSVASSWEQMRRIGATARIMLIEAAAKQWRVPASECHAENGYIIHKSGKKLSYGELADAANQLVPPTNVPLKSPKDFKLIGKPTKRLDSPEKVNGTAQFGLDVYLPDMLTVVIARSPVFGGKVKSFNADEARKVPGVKAVFQVPSGVAVAATTFWPAKTAREMLKIEWDEGPEGNLSSSGLVAEYTELAQKPGNIARKQGAEIDEALHGAHKSVSAAYEVPYLAHAPMEPLNCVVDLRKDSCEIWTGTQMQTVDRATAAAIAGLKPEQVQIHTTYLGGGFGRRANPVSDFVGEAIHAAKELKQPVKVVWTREDDIHGGFYRPLWVDHIEAGIDKNGKPVAWHHTIVGQSITTGTPFEGFMVKDGVDATSVEGAANMPYAIPNIQVDLHSPRHQVPVLWWRSVGHSHTAFVVETMIDELAQLAGQDPVQYRLGLLDGSPRHQGVLRLAAEKAGWGKTLPQGHALGVAVHFSFDSYAAEVAEISLDNGKVRVHRVVCAVDCGFVVNPDGVRQQLESAVVYGLSAALHGAITLENGRVQQSNFHDYPPLRYAEMPEIEVHIVQSDAPPTGIGEPGTPPIAPAVANAVFALTGKRVRRLPLDKETLV